jgi:hypothetical protein
MEKIDPDREKNEALRKIRGGNFSRSFTPGEGEYTEKNRLKDPWRCDLCWDGNCTRGHCSMKALCTV